MAHFAEIDKHNKVIRVVVINNADILVNGVESEEKGIDFCSNLFGGTLWKQTSYNTYKGQHNSEGVPFRKNYAAFGYSYDHTRDAFVPPQPYPSWILDEETCIWEAPVSTPDNGQMYQWNEEITNWELRV